MIVGSTARAETGSSVSTGYRGIIVNKDQVKGTAKEIAGKVQQATGKLVGSKEQQVKGLAHQVEGKVQKGVGDVKEAVKESKGCCK